ncbi:hypothetical protein OAH18_01620 [bacterium]|nr:hypothetical protein [bacterium]
MTRSAIQRLNSWQRILRIKNAERDQQSHAIIQQQAELQSLKHDIEKLNQHTTSTPEASLAAAANNDFVLLTAISVQARVDSQTLNRLQSEVAAAESSLQSALTQQGRLQRLITVLEKRIDESNLASTFHG